MAGMSEISAGTLRGALRILMFMPPCFVLRMRTAAQLEDAQRTNHRSYGGTFIGCLLSPGCMVRKIRGLHVSGIKTSAGTRDHACGQNRDGNR